MAYTYTKAELLSLGVDTFPLDIIQSEDLYLGAGKFAFGELLSFRFEIHSSAAFNTGQKFIINPCLFSPSPYASQYILGIGWLVEIISISGLIGTFDISLRIGSSGASITERNYKLLAQKIDSKTIQFDLVFYAGQDLFQYLTGQGQNNSQRLLSAGIGQGLLQSGQQNIYTRDGYLEVLSYETNNTLLPLTGIDPYVRSLSNPAQKQASFLCSGRFVDNDELNSQGYSGSALIKNNLSSAAVNTATLGKITDIGRRAFPVLNSFNDTNFATVFVDGEPSDKLIIDGANSIELTIKTPSGAPTNAVLMLMRVDSSAFADAQPFPIEYAVQRAEITNDVTAYPNPINNTPFSTPSSVVTSSGVTIIKAELDGTLLAQGATYRVWAGLYYSASYHSTSHLTPPLRAVLQTPPSIAISGVNQSYNNSFTGNDTVMTTLARHLAGIVLDSSTYTGVSFGAELLRVKFAAYFDNNLYETGRYNFRTQDGSGSPEIKLAVLGSSYLFPYISRLPYNDTLGNKTLRIEWSALFEYTDVFGSLQSVNYLYTQFVRVRPLESASILPNRILPIVFLDYTDWLASIETPIRSICDDNPFVVVKVEKDGAPDANLIALAVIGAAQNSNNPPAIFEEESYPPLTLLPQESTALLSQVDNNFGDNFAYFVLDARFLPASNSFNAVVAIIYDI